MYLGKLEGCIKSVHLAALDPSQTCNLSQPQQRNRVSAKHLLAVQSGNETLCFSSERDDF